ncbi:putative hydrolase PNKD [Dirofilaria immitis]
MKIKKSSLAFRFIYHIYNTNCFGAWYTKRQLNRTHEKLPNGHSSIATFIYGDIIVRAVPQNSDNYSYMVICRSTNDCVVIDVGDAKPILQCLNDENKIPQAVLITHKHWDHCYGNRQLKKRYKNLNIYGGEIDRPADVNIYVRNETLIKIGKLHFKALHVPGHTAGHIIYALQLNDEVKCLFTGDFLFIAGIGKIFEGSTAQMINSLLILNDFPPNTVIFPGHEYAKLNLSFALSLEKDNEILKAMNKAVHEKRITRLPIVGITLRDEYKINPYLRTCSLKFRKALVAAGYEVPAEAKIVADQDIDEVKDNSLEAQIAVFNALEKAKNDFTQELMKQIERKRAKNTRNNAMIQKFRMIYGKKIC